MDAEPSPDGLGWHDLLIEQLRSRTGSDCWYASGGAIEDVRMQTTREPTAQNGTTRVKETLGLVRITVRDFGSCTVATGVGPRDHFLHRNNGDKFGPYNTRRKRFDGHTAAHLCVSRYVPELLPPEGGSFAFRVPRNRNWDENVLDGNDCAVVSH